MALKGVFMCFLDYVNAKSYGALKKASKSDNKKGFHF